MRQQLQAVAVAAVLVAASASVAMAQKNSGGGFNERSTDIGPVIGLGGIGSAGLSFGGRFERAIKRLPDLGDGVLALQLSADYYSYSNTIGTVGYNFKYIPIGATANYHIKVNNTKFDPFVGAGLGYLVVSSSFNGTGYSNGSGIYFVGRAGLRYYMANGVALYGDVGAGAATLNAGVMFRMSGNK